MKRPLLIISAIIMMCGASFAGRPLSTDDSGTLGQGGIEIESGIDYTESKDDDYETALVVACKAGMLKNFDLGIEAPYLFIAPGEGDPVSGTGDLTVKAKINAFDGGKELPSFSIGLSNSILTANRDKGLGAEETEFTVNAIFSKSMGRVAVHFNSAQTSIGEGKDTTSTFSIAAENNYIEGATAVAELINENSLATYIDDDTREEEREFSSDLSALIGFNWELNDNFKADFGLRFGLSSDSFRNSFTAGVTYSN